MRESYALTGDEQPVDRVEVNGKMVKFPCYTRVYCIYDDKVIIGVYQDFMEATFTKEQWGKNIWCYRDDGSLLWKIEESPHWLEWLEKQSPEEKQKIFTRGHKDYYRLIAYKKNEKTGEEWLLVRATTGYYDLDPETGKVSNFEYDGGR